MPPSSTSKKSTRRIQRATHPRRADSDATSSSGDSSDLTTFSEDELSPTANHYQPDELDEPITYIFRNGDPVWVRTEDGEWWQGTIAGTGTRRGATRQKEGLFFPVAFRHNSRRYFAPLNGDIKPDSVEVRRLLSEGGWL